MAKITFCINKASLASAARTDINALQVVTGSDMLGMRKALDAGRNVVALASIAAIGWRAPAGTEVVLDEELRDNPKHAALKFQCKARVAGADPFADIPKPQENLSNPLQGNVVSLQEHISQMMNPGPQDPFAKGPTERMSHDLDEMLSLTELKGFKGQLWVTGDIQEAREYAAQLGDVMICHQTGTFPIFKEALEAGETVVVPGDMLHKQAYQALRTKIEMTSKARDNIGFVRQALEGCREWVNEEPQDDAPSL